MGCGSCKPEVKAILDAIQQKARAAVGELDARL
jgi:hypothetical protein